MSTDTRSKDGRTGEDEDVADTLDAVEVVHEPARLSAGLACVAALLAVLTSAPASALAMVVGLFGFGGFAVGLFAVRSWLLVGISTAVIFASVIVSGLFGNETVLVVISTFATILAFDYGQNAFSVGTQLTAATETTRGEIVHAATSAIGGTITVAITIAVYLIVGGEQSIAALVFLLLASVLLVWTIRS